MISMLQHIHDIKDRALQKILEATTLLALEEIEKEVLGKSGSLNMILKGLKDLSPEERQEVGGEANKVKKEIMDAHSQRKDWLYKQEIERKIAEEWMDVTLPGKKNMLFAEKGGLHPHTIVSEECLKIFKRLGFTVWEGPHIVSDFDNFEAVNVPKDHPARDMQDTFYVEKGFVLRTQTSSMQNTILKTRDFPIRAVVPGRVFRNEATDCRHEATFLQLEGLMVDKGITISHLIWVLQDFLKELFGKDIKFRIRPGYFPFVEPGMELEIYCLVCKGKGCGLCKGIGWTEVMPCGMIHPKVLELAGIDSTEYSGFAFGFGLSRLVQMKYGLEDARMLFSDDMRFLKQFS